MAPVEITLITSDATNQRSRDGMTQPPPLPGHRTGNASPRHPYAVRGYPSLLRHVPVRRGARGGEAPRRGLRATGLAHRERPDIVHLRLATGARPPGAGVGDVVGRLSEVERGVGRGIAQFL